MTRELRDYAKAGLTAIAAQQLFGSGVKLRPGQTVEYVITYADNTVPNDHVRAFALWEGWQGYDREKYRKMLHEAFEPFEQYVRDEEAAVGTATVSFGDLSPHPLFAALRRAQDAD